MVATGLLWVGKGGPKRMISGFHFSCSAKVIDAIKSIAAKNRIVMPFVPECFIWLQQVREPELREPLPEREPVLRQLL